eukprot:1150084-Karenia_brevis.AAC.1
MNGGGQSMPTPPLPAQVHGAPAVEPDVFSDGSFTDSSHPYFALSTAAVWWPDRNVDSKPLSELEQNYSLDHQSYDGLE